MSNDITILTAKLKAAALKAKSDANEWGYDTDAFHDVATPDAVIELVDALLVKEEQRANWFEMAQKLGEELDLSEKRIAHLENDEVRQRLSNAEHQLHMAELAKQNLRASRKAQFRKRKAAEKSVAELEAQIETADKLQDSAFRHGLQHGFSYGQTNNQAGYEQCMSSYSSRGKDNG